jgi:hypothetical protein
VPAFVQDAVHLVDRVGFCVVQDVIDVSQPDPRGMIGNVDEGKLVNDDGMPAPFFQVLNEMGYYKLVEILGQGLYSFKRTLFGVIHRCLP